VSKKRGDEELFMTKTITIPANKITIMRTAKKAVPKRKATKAKQLTIEEISQLTIEQISFNIPIGAAMEMFFSGASKKDFRHARRIFDAIDGGLEGLMDDINIRPLAMAVLDYARLLVQAQAEFVQTGSLKVPGVRNKTRVINGGNAR
jgi:hypothetical protein